MERRELLTAGALGTMIGVVAGEAHAAEQPSQSGSGDRTLNRVRELLEELAGQLRADRQFADIAPIRQAQKAHLRFNGRLPDFIDLGADPWFAAYDWHVRWQHRLVEGRDAQGRLTLTMNGTQLVLRSDVAANYISQPYDAR